MAATTLPIILQPLPVPTNLQALDLNQLLAIFAEYMQAEVDTENVSLFIQGSVDPSSDVGLFYNNTSHQFKYWYAPQGRYVPISDFVVGDVLETFLSGDEVARGFVSLDGRTVEAAITNLDNFQAANLQTLFGAAGTLPTLQTVTTNGTKYTKVYVGAQ